MEEMMSKEMLVGTKPAVDEAAVEVDPRYAINAVEYNPKQTLSVNIRCTKGIESIMDLLNKLDVVVKSGNYELSSISVHEW